MKPRSLLDRIAAETERHAARPLHTDPLRITAPSTVTVGSVIDEGIAKLVAEKRYTTHRLPRENHQLPSAPDADQLATKLAHLEHKQDEAWQARVAEANSPNRSR